MQKATSISLECAKNNVFHLDGTYGIKEYRMEDFRQLTLCSNLFAIMDSDREKETDPPSGNILETQEKIELSGRKAFVLKYRTLESYFDEEIVKKVLKIEHIGRYTPYDEMKKILINIAEANGKKYRASIEGRRITKAQAEIKGIPKEFEELFEEIAETTAKRIGLRTM